MLVAVISAEDSIAQTGAPKGVNTMLKSVPGLLTIALSIGAIATPTYAADNFQGNGRSVFVMTNDNTKNEVLAYHRDYNGQYVLKTRTATDGRGSGGKTDPLQSQGALTLSGDHNLLFAVNSWEAFLFLSTRNLPGALFRSL
jgi:hypothetical protein